MKITHYQYHHQCLRLEPRLSLHQRLIYQYMLLDGVGETGARGGGLAGRFSTTSSSRRQCWWWGRIWFISHCDSFYKLCSVSLHSEAARVDRNWCHQGSCWQRPIQYTSSIGFAFFFTRLGGIFLKCARMVASTRDEP